MQRYFSTDHPFYAFASTATGILNRFYAPQKFCGSKIGFDNIVFRALLTKKRFSISFLFCFLWVCFAVHMNSQEKRILFVGLF